MNKQKSIIAALAILFAGQAFALDRVEVLERKSHSRRV